jgi:hypothetical protein
MFSAFSFGKIIKTILPGAILTVGLFLLLEAVWGLWQPGKGFLLAHLEKDWIAPMTAGLIPLSLLLGFFLNTFAWMVFNKRMKKRCSATLHSTAYSEMRTCLSEGLWAETAKFFADREQHLQQVPAIDRHSLEYLEYYYLPVVTLEHLNYLWESYFCWYEFDINTICAVGLSVPAAGLLLWVKLRASHLLLVVLLLLLLALSVALCRMLSIAAAKNLETHEKNLLLLITASLAKAATSASSS